MNMKRIILMLSFILITVTSIAQEMKPIWAKAYTNDKLVSVFAINDTKADIISLIVKNQDQNITIMIFDNEKFIRGLEVCCDNFNTLTLDKHRNIMIESIDTLFPKVAIFYEYQDTLIGSYNNIITNTLIKYRNETSLTLEGIAYCRIKFDNKTPDPNFNGDADIVLNYEIEFNNVDEIQELIDAITQAIKIKDVKFNVPNYRRMIIFKGRPKFVQNHYFQQQIPFRH